MQPIGWRGGVPEEDNQGRLDKAAKSRGRKRRAWTCGDRWNISNEPRNGKVTLPLPPSQVGPRRERGSASIHRYVHGRHFVPDEVSVYVCEQHRPVGLEVPAAFWNDVVGRGRFSREAAPIRQTPKPSRGLVPFISALANCPIILDGRWPIVSAKYQL